MLVVLELILLLIGILVCIILYAKRPPEVREFQKEFSQMDSDVTNDICESLDNFSCEMKLKRKQSFNKLKDSLGDTEHKLSDEEALAILRGKSHELRKK